MSKRRVRINLFRFPARLCRIIKKTAAKTVDSEKAGISGAVNVILVPDKTIKKLNMRFRSVKRVTDVISFSYGLGGFEGDIFIAEGRSKRQAAEFGHGWKEELVYLTIHGVLHLLKYSDYTALNRKKMFSRQDRIFKCLMQ